MVRPESGKCHGAGERTGPAARLRFWNIRRDLRVLRVDPHAGGSAKGVDRRIPTDSQSIGPPDFQHTRPVLFRAAVWRRKEEVRAGRSRSTAYGRARDELLQFVPPGAMGAGAASGK